MNNYTYFATVYDRMMDNIPYEEWEQYILQLFYRYGVAPCSHVAELGCGTGVMTRLLSSEGFVMTGIDLSEDMLEVAKCKDTSDINYICRDMRNFELSTKQDAIISVCDSMNYLLTEEDITKTFSSVKRNLKSGGVFIFDLKTEYFFVNELDGEVFAEDMGDFSYVWRNRYNREEHIHHYLLEFNVKSGLGKNRKDNASKKDTILDHKHLRLIKEHHRQRSFSAGDIKQAALNAGFNKANVYDAFTFRKPLKSSGRIYVVMRNED